MQTQHVFEHELFTLALMIEGEAAFLWRGGREGLLAECHGRHPPRLHIGPPLTHRRPAAQVPWFGVTAVWWVCWLALFLLLRSVLGGVW